MSSILRYRWPLAGSVAAAALMVPASAQEMNVTIHERGSAYPGYTTHITEPQVLNPNTNTGFVVFDMDGAVVHVWKDPLPNWAFAELVKPLSQGHILALIYDRATAGGPRSKRLVELDWNGNVLWQFDPQPFGYILHHDFQRLANGNTILAAVKTRFWSGQLFYDEELVELDSSGQIVWSWSAITNADQLGLTSLQWAYLFALPGSPKTIFHLNSVQSLPPNKWEASDPRFRAGNLLVSMRDLNLVFIIDKLTGAVVWRYTGAIGQHHPRMIERELPGEGNILLLDNGGQSGAPPINREYSRVIEMEPATLKVVWQYACRSRDCDDYFFTFYRGSAQRLPNGNTLIAEAGDARVFEVTPHGETVWEYVSQGDVVYRAYRISANWPTKNIAAFNW